MILKDGFYLSELVIQNIATFELERIKFTPDFNCIVGETGSGKSLILDCLQLIFGGRADKSIIRKNTPFATIEAIFKTTDKKITEYFTNIGYPFNDDEIVIKKVIQKNGSSKSFINHQSCSIQTLTIFAKTFIDLVGQFENQKLLSENYQLKLIDQFGGLELKSALFRKKFEIFTKSIWELESLQQSRPEKLKRLDYINFQISELEKLSPTKKDEDQLIRRKEELQNIISEQQTFTQINHLLIAADGDNVLSSLKKTSDLISNLSISNAEDLHEQMLLAINIVEDVSYDISKLTGEMDDVEFSEIIDRLDKYQIAKRKFSTDINGLAEALEDFKKEILTVNDEETQIKRLQKLVKHTKLELNKLAEELHIERTKHALLLERELTNRIQELRMEGASINLELLKNTELTQSGLNSLNFLAETNPGEGFSHVKKTASGGELSRILLAFRQVLSSKDSISIFLFDEIDTGVGGETAKKIGSALQEVSSKGQVIAITHLPQIAALANNLILVDKLVDSKEKRTKTLVQVLSGKKIDNVIEKMATVH
ncbi:MAG: AAA family ATPase [Bacteriovoracaceae bacterium]|mgnify:CR=1 FL=1|jgi:DNA repair protein RecN (Recombination protein N)|nr:AAA family ATPase [Bacteriovoracaceae bacterium]